MLLRYHQELVDPEDYKLPGGAQKDYRISPKEQEMAKQLIESMAGKWKPDDFHDEFRARLETVLKKRIKAKGWYHLHRGNRRTAGRRRPPTWSISCRCCEKSLQANKRTPAKKSATKKAPARKAAKKATKAAAKKAPARRKAS